MRISATKAIRRQMLVDVRRSVDGVNTIDGFVLAQSEKWLLVKDANALQPDGFWIFRLDSISGLYRTRFQEFKESMLKRSGLLARLHALPSVELAETDGILRSLIKNRRLCILFVENKRTWWRVHCAIRKQTETGLTLQPFDGAGRWTRATIIQNQELKAITAIRFDSHYLRLYEKYTPRK